MNLAFLCIHKIDELINKPSKDIDANCLWISPISHVFRRIEDFKISGRDETFINKDIEKYKSFTEKGIIYSVGLTRDKIETFIRSDSSYFEEYCNQSKNPMQLADEISLLKLDNSDFWEDDIILGMKNC